MIGYVLVNFTLPRGKTLNRRVKLAHTYEAVKSFEILEIMANSVSRVEELTLRNGSASNINTAPDGPSTGTDSFLIESDNRRGEFFSSPSRRIRELGV